MRVCRFTKGVAYSGVCISLHLLLEIDAGALFLQVRACEYAFYGQLLLSDGSVSPHF